MYIARLKKDTNGYKKGDLVEVTNELLPGSMTGCDSFRQGRVIKEVKQPLTTFDYFDLEPV